MIRFCCTLCGEKISVQHQLSGKRIKCPKCGGISVVPEKSPQIKFPCKNCGQPIRVPQIHAGKKGRCPKCKNIVVVPSLKAGMVDGSETVTIVCPMCNETIQAPEGSKEQFIECPGCSSYMEAPSGIVKARLAESGPSIPSGADEDAYENESDLPPEGAGVDRRLILAICGAAVVVVVGLIILITVVLPSGSRQVREPAVPPRQEVGDADLRPQPVTSETQPTEPIAEEPQNEDILPKESSSLDEKQYEKSGIVFSSSRDGNSEIYFMKRDGSGLKNLTNNPAPDTNPSWSADGKRIAFASRRDGNWDIYIMKPDGSGQERLTTNPTMDMYPCWSPDGKRIAFESKARTRDAKGEIHVINVDGSGLKNLTNNPASDQFPCWSPDGKKIAFASFRDRKWQIYLMNPDGSEENRLTNSPASDRFPSWSPDGKRIAFNSASGREADICVMNADGTARRNLTNNPANDQGPSWSPDGTKIVFSSNRDGDREIYVMNADGTGLEKLTDNPAFDVFPSWSPVPPSEAKEESQKEESLSRESVSSERKLYKQTKIAFTSGRGINAEIYVMNSDGSERKRLTNNRAGDTGPTWSPDGKKIAFRSKRDRNYEIYIMNADGTEQRRLTNDPQDDDHPRWSPNGKKIAFASGRDGNREIYIMNTDGSEQRNLSNNPAHDFAPSFSPDGKKIAFQTDRDGNLEIYVMNADGSGQNNLTNNPATDEGPVWSPDGKSIAFASWRGNQWDIYMMSADGSEQKNLSNSRLLSKSPSWSPDGRKIVFHAIKGHYDIFVMNADGSEQKNLTNDPSTDLEPSWSPFLGSEPLPVEEPESRRERQEITDAALQPRPVTSVESAAVRSSGLKLRLRPGQKHRLRLIREDKVSLTTMGQRQDIHSISTVDLDFEVEQIDANSIAWIKVTYLALREKGGSTAGTMEYDSTKPEMATDYAFASTYSAMIGQSFVMKVSPYGKMLELQGIDEMYLRMAEKIVDEEDESIRKRATERTEEGAKERAERYIEVLNQKYGSRKKREESVRDLIKKNPFFAAEKIRGMVGNVIMSFPGGPVETGDSWQGGAVLPAAAPVDIDLTYTLKEKKQGVAVIDISSKIELVDETASTSDSPLGLTKTSLTGSYEGSLQIDSKTGWMIRKKATMRCYGEMKMAPNEQMQQATTMPVSMETVTTVEPIE